MPLPGVTPSPRESELSLLFDGSWKVINRTECEGNPDDWVQFLGKYSNAPLCPGYVSYWWYNTSVTPPTCWDIICKRATSTTSTTTTTTTTTFHSSGENTFEWPPAATWCLIGLLLSCLCFAGYRWAQRPKSRDPRLEARNETLSFLGPRQGTNQYEMIKSPLFHQETTANQQHGTSCRRTETKHSFADLRRSNTHVTKYNVIC